MSRVRPTSALTWSRFDRAVHEDGYGSDLTELTFIDAFGLVGAAVAIAEAIDVGTLPVITIPSRHQVSEHLSHMGLADVLDDLGVDHDLPPTPTVVSEHVVMPLNVVSEVSTIEGLSLLLVNQLERWVHAQVLVAITEALWELAANALEHSGAKAFMMGQVYKREPPDHDRRVQVVIGDAGRGIRESFRATRTHEPADDRAAIDLAVQYLVSSVPDSGRGQGLFTTISEVTGLGGAVIVRSGTARLVARRGTRTMTSVPRAAGTIVGVSLPLYPGIAR